MRYIKYDDISISYKKRKILFSEINSVVFKKFILSGHISINKPFKKNSLSLSNLPWKKYIELKELILEKACLSKVKIRNWVFIQLFYPIVFVLLFISSFIINPNIPKYNFDEKVSIQPNVETNHYSFRIDGIKYETMLSDSLFFLLTDKGKIFYKEFYDEGVSLRKFFDYPQLFEVNDLSQIDYWYSNDVGVFKRMCRYFSISVFKPILFESEEFKGVLLTTEDRKIKSLRLKKKSEKGFLLIEFSNQFIIDNVIEFLESVSYH
ncbi:MAG: hypothetical protein KAT74_07900 [Candidatus Cloacimonetes bacterium]|nr:hypothetical protein [Candidatus Cloacimonadota bacterium]